MKARLHPRWVGGRDGYRYSVIYDGKLLVDRSRDPECDAARALLAKGINGKLTLLEGKTGKPRTIIDIEKAARLTVREDKGRGPCIVKHTPWDSMVAERVEGEAHSPGTASGGDQVAA